MNYDDDGHGVWISVLQMGLILFAINEPGLMGTRFWESPNVGRNVQLQKSLNEKESSMKNNLNVRKSPFAKDS